MITMFTIIQIYLLLIIVKNIDSNTFIWDPNNTDNIEIVKPFINFNNFNQNFNNNQQQPKQTTTFTNPSKCLKIPKNLTLCNNIKYNEMRLPNLLYHETINEIIEQSMSWIQLIKINCHQDTQLFLCSLFTPVCLDQTIPPCRSLCENVKRNCEPSMLIHGYSWPPMMQCNLFPIDNNMCIESQQMTNSATISTTIPATISTTTTIVPDNKHQNNNQNNRTENERFQRQLLQAICNSDWVIKIGMNQIRDNRKIRVKKFKTIYGTINRTSPFFLTTNNSTTIILTKMNTNNNGKEKFIIIGNNDLSINLIINWQKNSLQIKKAIRKIKNNENHCPKSLSTTMKNKPQSNNNRKSRNRNRKKLNITTKIH